MSVPQNNMPGKFSSFKGKLNDPLAVANWIMENVPCFKGPVPQNWTTAAYSAAYQSRIPQSVITNALSLSGLYGYHFQSPRVIKPQDLVLLNTGPHMSSVDPSQRRANMIATMKMLDDRFRFASAAGNSKQMEELAKAFADLLNSAEASPLGPEVEMVHGAPLTSIRRAVVRDGSDLQRPPVGGGRGCPAGGGPYRVAPWVTYGLVEAEGEGEAE